MTCSVFMRRTNQWKKKKKKKRVSKQINLHMNIYKTHDLLNNSRTRICSSKDKNKIINKILLVFLYLDTTHL